MGKIAERWMDYRRHMLADKEIAELRTSIDELVFFAGAAAMLATVHELMGSDLPPEDVVDRLQGLHKELVVHHFCGSADNRPMNS